MVWKFRIRGVEVQIKTNPIGLTLYTKSWYFHSCSFLYPNCEVLFQVRLYDRLKQKLIYQWTKKKHVNSVRALPSNEIENGLISNAAIEREKATISKQLAEILGLNSEEKTQKLADAIDGLVRIYVWRLEDQIRQKD